MHYLFKVILLKSKKVLDVLLSLFQCESIGSTDYGVINVLHIVIAGVELTLLQGFRYFVEGIIDFHLALQ